MSHFIASDWHSYERIKDRMEKMPRYDHRGDKIEKPFAYILKEILERVTWLSPSWTDMAGSEVIVVRITFEQENVYIRAVAEVMNE